jgi:hypothetical protein
VLALKRYAGDAARLQLCVTFQILPLFGVRGAGVETPKSTTNISGPLKRTSMGLLKPLTAKTMLMGQARLVAGGGRCSCRG